MKKCQKCGFEDRDEISFCRECGSPMRNTPQMVVPLSDLENQQNEQVTETLSPEVATVVGNRFQQSVPTISTQKPQSKILIFAVFGGILLLLLIVIGGAGAFLYIYFQTNQTIETANSAPKLEAKKSKPTKTPSPNPTTEVTPDKIAEQTFPPPTTPTKRGSFRIAADTDKWQLSEIETVFSETFATSVKGIVDLSEIDPSISPSGVESNSNRRIYMEYPTGALLMRTRFADGKTSNIQPIAASEVWENAPDESGRLEFLINDKAPSKNKGSFIVSVSLVGVPE